MNNNANNTISSPAWLLISENHIGVTDKIEDIIAYNEKYLQPGETIILKKDYADELFKEEQKILTIDNLCNSDGDSLIVPHRPTDFNLIERKSSPKQLVQVVEIFKNE